LWYYSSIVSRSYQPIHGQNLFLFDLDHTYRMEDQELGDTSRAWEVSIACIIKLGLEIHTGAQ
jgi:hypothetical protein